VTAFTVAELRAAIAELPDDMPVIVRACGEEYDYTDCTVATTITLDWAPEDDAGNAPVSRRCLAVE